MTNISPVNTREATEPSANLSSYFTSESASEDIFDSVFGRDLQQQMEVTKTSISPRVMPVPVVKDTATLCLLRQYDAWLPSEATRHVLFDRSPTKSATGPAIRPTLSDQDYEASTKLLTDPYLDILANHQRDITQLSVNRTLPTSDDFDQPDCEQLKNLITNGWYRAALYWTRQFLSRWGYREDCGGAVLTPWSAQVWLTRLALLVRVQNFDVAEKELASFQTLDSPNIYFEYSPELYPGRFGSIIPFSLRLLHAVFPYYRGRVEEALDRLYYLLATIGRIRCNLKKGYTEDGSTQQPDSSYAESSLSIWTCREVRVLSNALSIYLSEMDYMAAVETVHQIASVCSNDPSILRGLSSVLGRIYLQLGDLESSKMYFSRSAPSADAQRQLPTSTEQLFQRALLSVGRGEYDDAKKLFQQILSIDPSNVAAANNMVVCSLYVGHLSAAMHILETLTSGGLSGETHCLNQSDIQRRLMLHESLVYNLAVLYEVESDGAMNRKLQLLEKVAYLPGEHVSISAFKL